jgi:mannose-6-phosphate isomerase-like protein (cupin superfamily)
MRLPRDHIIKPHLHNTTARTVHHTHEVLVILRGQLRVDFYTLSQEYCESRVLLPFDVVLLISGGHGFQVLEATEMLEIKQGPYLGAADKTTFEVPDPTLITIRGEGA